MRLPEGLKIGRKLFPGEGEDPGLVTFPQTQKKPSHTTDRVMSHISEET